MTPINKNMRFLGFFSQNACLRGLCSVDIEASASQQTKAGDADTVVPAIYVRSGTSAGSIPVPGFMIAINKKFRDPIVVEWVDACECDGWKSLKDAIVVPDEVYVTTRGFYLNHTKEFLTLAASVGRTKDNEVGGVWHIPRVWIKKIK